MQLSLLEPSANNRPSWSLEGCACEACQDGRMFMVAPSDPCSCTEAICICLAEGYAMCDTCGELKQVWPREMAAVWSPSDEG